MVAAIPVWLSGSPQLQRTLADGLLAGGLACFGVSEPDHGSDLHSTETVLEHKDGRPAADRNEVAGRQRHPGPLRDYLREIGPARSPSS